MGMGRWVAGSNLQNVWHKYIDTCNVIIWQYFSFSVGGYKILKCESHSGLYQCQKTLKSRVQHFGIYSFSNNHGSGKMDPLGDKPLIFQGPIFHFHDYGRQGINPYIVGHSQYLVPSILKDDIETDCLQTFVTLSVCWMPNSMYKLNPCNRFKGELMKIFIWMIFSHEN